MSPNKFKDNFEIKIQVINKFNIINFRQFFKRV